MSERSPRPDDTARRDDTVPAPAALGPHPTGHAIPDRVVRAGLAARRALAAGVDRLGPIELALWQMTTGLALTKMLAAVARLRIADLLAEAPRDASEIASLTRQHPDAMHRTMRALVSQGVFALDEAGRFTNNFRSEGLRSGRPGAMRELVAYFGSRSNVDAWNRFDETLQHGTDGFALHHGMNVWDWFEAHPAERDVFAAAMTGITITMAPVVASLVAWGELGTVCDVGGGRGTLLSELLLRFPGLRGVLYDGAGVIELARELLAARGVLDRVTLETGSFFERVPSGADAYVLKNVLHDWGDDACKTILGNVRAACRPGQKVLLLETITEMHDVHGTGPMSDVQMMMVCEGGRERSRAEYAALLSATGFAPSRVSDHALISAIEGIAR